MSERQAIRIMARVSGWFRLDSLSSEGRAAVETAGRRLREIVFRRRGLVLPWPREMVKIRAPGFVCGIRAGFPFGPGWDR
jgi:hypothetical protein